MSDKRYNQRIKVDLLAEIVILGYPQNTFRTKIIDVSPKGVAFISTYDIDKGLEAELHIDIDKKNTVFFKAKIVNSELISRITKEYKVSGMVIGSSSENDRKYLSFYQGLLDTIQKKNSEDDGFYILG